VTSKKTAARETTSLTASQNFNPVHSAILSYSIVLQRRPDTDGLVFPHLTCVIVITRRRNDTHSPFLNALDLASQKFRNVLPYVDSVLSYWARNTYNTLANGAPHCLRTPLVCRFNYVVYMSGPLHLFRNDVQNEASLIGTVSYPYTYNTRHKSLKQEPFVLNFLQISYIHASHLCSHSNVPLSFPNVTCSRECMRTAQIGPDLRLSPMLSRAYFGALK